MPSFPNVFDGRDRIDIREDTPTTIKLRYVTLAAQNYSAASLADELQFRLNENFTLVDNTHQVTSETVVAGSHSYTSIACSLAGSNTEESARLLTDAELLTLTDTSPVWDLSGDYALTQYDFTAGGTWADSRYR